VKLTVARITSLAVVAAGAIPLIAADRTTEPTFLRRRLPEIAAAPADVSTATCRYQPVFGVGDKETRIVRGVARFGQVTIDAGGECTPVEYPREEQIYVVVEGSPTVLYGSEQRPLKKEDFVYLPPTVRHGLSNPGSAPARVLIMGWKIPNEMPLKIPETLQMANINDVPLQVVGNHPPSSKFRLLVGTTDSKRDRIAAAHVMTSLFVMEFTPGGTNFPHHHPTEEEFYLLMEGSGDMVAGSGMDGIEGRHPAKPGDAYFFRLNCTVGFYSSPDPKAPRARILAARSLYPGR
jgi:mannose-6-phosphate isomerase-like protein (cupin superfamily)